MNLTATTNQPIARSVTSYLPTDSSNTHTGNLMYDTKSILLITLYISIFILGVAGNSSVIVFFAKKVKRSLYDTYILHLAIADLLVSLCTPPRTIFTILSHEERAHFTKAGCRIMSAIEPISVNASSWILASIAIERYRGIVQPLKPRYRRGCIHLTVLVIWLLSFICFIPYINAITVVGKHCLPRWNSPRKELAFNLSILFVQSLVPLVIMSYTLICIANVMRERSKAILGKSKRGHAKEVNLLLVLLVAFLVFTACTLPYNVFYVAMVYELGITGDLKKLGDYITMNDWFGSLVLLSSVTNCCIYAGLHKGFKTFCKRCMQRRKKKGKSSSKCPLTVITEKPRKTSSNQTSNNAKLL